MNTQVISIQNNFQHDLNGSVSFLFYCFMNLCIKAEPAALLSAEFEQGGLTLSIEDMGDVAQPDKYRLCVVPKESEDIPYYILEGRSTSWERKKSLSRWKIPQQRP